jgi:hypothetical protein
MKKMNFTSTTMRFVLSALGFFALMLTANAQCKEKLTLFLDPNCGVLLTAGDLNATSNSVTIKKPGLPAISVTLPYGFGKADVGTEYEVMSMTGNNTMCFTYVKVLDDLAPITTIPDVYIRCNEVVNGKAPAPGAVFFGKSLTAQRMLEPIGIGSPKGSLLNPYYLGTGRQTFTVDDCHNFSASYQDVAGIAKACPSEYNNCESVQLIQRNWKFIDIYGNDSYYTQNIYVYKPAITFPGTLGQDPHTWATTYTLNFDDCRIDATAVGLPYIDWNCNGTAQAEEIVQNQTDYCGQNAVLVTSNRMNTCPGSYMVTREWKVKKCDNTFETIKQVINVNDKFIPLLGLKYWDYQRIPEPQCFDMNGMKITEFVYKPVVVDVLDGAGGGAPAAGGIDKVFKISPLVNLANCNQAMVKIDMTVSDPNCNSYPITVTSSDPRLTFNGMSNMVVNSATELRVAGTFSSIADGVDPFVIISATDACGNTVNIKLVIVVIDNLSPEASCEDKQTTLTTNGQTLITGYELSDKSRDNCEIKRRLVKLKGTDCWSDNLILDCAHIGYDSIDVRIIDKCDNYTDCCVRVQILDKAGPTCPMSPDVRTTCNNPLLAPATIAGFFTQPTAYDNCETPSVTESTSALNLNCGAGEVIKTWTFSDKAGNKAVCTQKLIITPELGFRVTRIRSKDESCSGIPSIEDEKKAILASIKNLRGSTVTCSAPAVKITEMVYMATDYCKRVMRTYEVVDLCLYPGQQPACRNTAFLPTNFSTSSLEIQDGENGANNPGMVCWSRHITIYDNTPPVPAVVAAKEVCVIDATCAADFPTVTLNATDKCSADNVSPTYLFYRWQVRAGSAAGGVISEGTGTGSGVTNTLNIAATATNGLRGLALGIYYVTFVVVDDCGNVAGGTPVKVTIKDCKSPYINTHDKNTVLAYRTDANGLGQGMSQVCLEEVLNDYYDNCTSKETLFSKMKLVRASANPTNKYPASAGRCVMFSCADLAAGTVELQLWSVDNAENAVFNVVTITVQDNSNACGGDVPQSIIKGGLKTEMNQSAANVSLSATIAGTIANTVTTDAAGAYTLNVAQGSNTVVKAAKTSTDDKYAGVTTFDIARISKHILDIDNFSSAYQMIAADVNKDGVVDAIDMVQIRNFILRKSTSLPGGVWRFVDKSYTFRNPANPFGEDFPEVISLTNTKANETANFVAVKLGDVNATFTSGLAPTTARNAKSLVLTADDMSLVAGNEYTVTIAAENFNAAALQGTFSFNGATVKSVKSGDLANFGDGNVAIFNNEVTTSWNGATKASAEVITISFVANKTAKLSEVLTVGSALTPAVANDAQGTEMNVSLKFNTGKVAGAEFALYQNTPNPVATETTIGFNMPKEGTAKLTIYTVDGKVVMNKVIDAKAGLNNVSINKSDINANGVLYYRLETADQSATKKMIIVE